MKKNLTLKYCIQQFMFWATNCGVYSFAATFLLTKGFTASNIGLILFAANFCSFMLQPFVANYADKHGGNSIRTMMLSLAAICIMSFATVRFIHVPTIVFAVVYLIGITTLDMQNPLLNAENVYFTDRAWTINYGLARAMGAASYAVISLLMGYVMEDYGADWMPTLSLLFLCAYIVSTVCFPKDLSKSLRQSGGDTAVPLKEFFVKYKWYCISLFGVLFLAMFHTMVENYLIEIFGRLGGDSSNVGEALSIATAIEVPGMLLIPKIHNKLGTHKVLVAAGAFYLLKAVLFLASASVTGIYVAQLLQLVTYTFLSPVQMYYAKECTNESDMVKGQAVSTAVFSLGSAIGNLTGGELITALGVPAMLIAGVAIASLGTAFMLFAVPKALKNACA